MDLSEKIRTFITNSPIPVSYQEIAERAKLRGIGKLELIEALRKVHKMRSIRTTSRLGTIYYDPAPVHTVLAAPRLPADKYPVMDTTNDAHHAIFDGMDFSYMFKTPEEIKYEKFRKERELVNQLA